MNSKKPIKKVPGVFYGGGVSVKYAWHFLMVLFLAVSVNAENCKKSISSSQIDTSVGSSANLDKAQVDKIVEGLASFYVREIHFGESKNVSIQFQSFRKKLEELLPKIPEIQQYVDRRINKLLLSYSLSRESLQRTLKKQNMLLIKKFVPVKLEESSELFQKIQEDFKRAESERSSRIKGEFYFSRYDLNPNLEDLKYEIRLNKKSRRSLSNSQSFIIKKPEGEDISFLLHRELYGVNIKEHTTQIRDILFLDKDTFVTYALFDSKLNKWSIKERGHVLTFQDPLNSRLGPSSHDLYVLGMLQVNLNQILSWSIDGTLKLWNIKTGDLIRTYEHPMPQGSGHKVQGALLLENGDILSWSNEALIISDFLTGKILHKIERDRAESSLTKIIDGKIVSFDQYLFSKPAAIYWKPIYFDLNR